MATKKKPLRRKDELRAALTEAKLPFKLIEAGAAHASIDTFLIAIDTFLIPLVVGMDAEIRIITGDLVLYVHADGRAYFRGSLCTVGDAVALVLSWRQRAKKGEVL